MTYAKPCKVCGEYYPGDCFKDGCRDDKCECDGCETYHIMIQGEFDEVRKYE